MGLSEPAFGVLLTTFAAGSLVGSLAAAPLERRIGRVLLLLGNVVVAALTFAAPAFTTEPRIIGPVFVVSGAFAVIANVITVSLRQRIVPDHLLGRVNVADRLFAWGTQPLGAVVGGILGGLFGLPAVFVFAGALALTLLLVRWVIDEPALAMADAEVPAAA